MPSRVGVPCYPDNLVTSTQSLEDLQRTIGLWGSFVAYMLSIALRWAVWFSR